MKIALIRAENKRRLPSNNTQDNCDKLWVLYEGTGFPVVIDTPYECDIDDIINELMNMQELAVSHLKRKWELIK